jgi:hypothetical protein
MVPELVEYERLDSSGHDRPPAIFGYNSGGRRRPWQAGAVSIILALPHRKHLLKPTRCHPNKGFEDDLAIGWAVEGNRIWVKIVRKALRIRMDIYDPAYACSDDMPRALVARKGGREESAVSHRDTMTSCI